jgi:exopolysaccharide production protein ExoZ
MTTPDGKLWSIQYLRFIAAFGVILFHSCGATPYPFALGAIGVDLFFVISGFVMWHVVAAKPQTPGHFLSRRIRRIVPLYWTAIALVVFLVHVFGVRTLGATDKAVPVIKSLLFIPYFNSNGTMGPVVSPGWTLNYEMFFYAVFGASLFISAKYRFWLLAIIFLILWWCGQNYAFDNPLLSTYLNPICMEFWFGVVAAELSLRFRLRGWTGLGAMVAGLILVWLPDHFAGSAEPASRLTIATGISAIVTGFVGLEFAGKLPRIGWLGYGGEASYSLYLAQIFGFEAVRPLVGSLPGPAKALAFAGSALLMGFVAHELVEKPMNDLLTKAGRLRKIAPPLPAAAPAE